MSGAFMVRRRLPDGTFGPPEKVFGGESDSEKIARLEAEQLDTYEALAEIYEHMIGGSV